METPIYDISLSDDEENEDEVEKIAVFDRLYEEAKRRAERLKAESFSNRESDGDNEEAKECTFHPVVSDYVKQQGRRANWKEFLQSQNDQKKKVAIRLQKKKEEILSAERVPLFDGMPRKHSLRIIAHLEKERRYKGPVKGWRDRFCEYVTRSQKKDEGSFLNKSKFPMDASSVHSGIIQDGVVFDRLYNEALVRAKARRFVQLTRLEEEAREFYHPMTNESEYWGGGSGGGGDWSFCNSSGGPITSGRESRADSFLSNRTGNVFEDLYAMDEEYRRRRETRVMEALEKETKLTFKPLTNPQSSKIIMQRAIARAKGELQEPEEEKHRVSTTQVSNDDETMTSQERRRNSKFNVDIFCSRLQRKEAERLGRLAEVRRHLRMQETKECTFRPSISRNSHAMAAQRGYTQTTFEPSSDHSLKAACGRRMDVGYDGMDAADYGDTDVAGTVRRRVMFTPSQELEESFCSRRKSGSDGVKTRPESLCDIKRPECDYIAALSSEIQDVLSQWMEEAEKARSATWEE